jgi:hypothetical protein
MSAVITTAQLAALAEQALALGIDELNLTHATRAQYDAIAALEGARSHKQPWHSVAEGAWKILHVASVRVSGVTVTAHWQTFATADDLAAVGRLWSIP